MKNKKINIAVYGASGRMGQEILRTTKENISFADFNPIIGITRKKIDTGFDVSHPDLEKSLSKQLQNDIDVIIDFSLPESFDYVLRSALKLQKPLVTGVTGLSENQHKKLKTAAKKIPILWSSNMSIGVLVLTEAIASLARAEGFDLQIEEIHHKHKKDKPSGTAKTLQSKLIQHAGTKKINEPIAIRGGGIVGIHKVYGFSDSEYLCFEHQALNRRVFAEGALRAARWLSKQKNGMYTLSDILKK